MSRSGRIGLPCRFSEWTGARAGTGLKREENLRPLQPLIAEDRLKATTLKMLDEVVALPARGPLLHELDMSR